MDKKPQIAGTTQPEKLTLESLSILDDRIAKLREGFPEVFRDGKIDFEVLRRFLGEHLETGKERFGLSWPGKSDCIKVIQEPSVGTLVPMREESVDFDTTQNMVIEGDNLEVLKLLQKSYYGKVQMIFIDPPYNTGGEFIYPDRFQEGLQDYLRYSGQMRDDGFRVSTNTESGGRYHTNWLNMMWPRLFLARNLLRDDGVIFVSIDDHEVHNLKALLNEIFGEENFVTQIEWQKRYTRSNNTDNFTSVIDHILVYRKSLEFSVSLLPRNEEANARFTNPDNDPRGPWKATPFLNQVAPDRRPNLCYPITNPKTGKVTNPTSKAWRYERKVFEKLQEDNRLYWGKDGAREVPDIKTFLSEVRQGMTPINFWEHEYAGNTDLANREIKELFGSKVFDTPKPVQLIQRMLEHCGDKDGIVLDFFAGSGTTAHGVLAQNLADGGSRSFILVQLPEPVEGGAFPTISSITRERIRKAAKLLHPSTDGLFDAPTESDLGFRAYRLTTSNFKPWQGEADAIASVAEQLEAFADHVLDDRTAEDILTEILLKAGFELTTPTKRLTLAGKEVYSVADGALLVCLDRQLTLEVIEAMIDQKPSQIICLDAGFQNNDQLKVNAVQAIKSRARSEESTIVFKVV